MSKDLIVYFHGFGSSPYGDKVRAMRDKYDGRATFLAPVLGPDGDWTEHTVKNLLKYALEKADKALFVGTSLGGFWANYYGEMFDVTRALINPCLDPKLQLVRHVGTTVQIGDNAPFDFTQKMLDGYPDAQTPEQWVNYNTWHFLDLNDPVVDNTVLQSWIMARGLQNRAVYTHDGDHRFATRFHLVENFIESWLDGIPFVPGV